MPMELDLALQLLPPGRQRALLRGLHGDVHHRLHGLQDLLVERRVEPLGAQHLTAPGPLPRLRGLPAQGLQASQHLSDSLKL